MADDIIVRTAPALNVNNNDYDGSSSALSDVPNTDSEKADSRPGAPQDGHGSSRAFQTPQLSSRTEEIMRRVNANAGDQGYDAAREQVMKGMATANQISASPAARSSGSKRGARGGKRASFAGHGASGDDDVVFVKMEDDAQVTPGSGGRGRGRGRGGRPRGRARGSARSSGGKRKREDDDDDSDSDEVVTVATITKSGRSIQKPTTFVPPPALSPTTQTKRRRTYTRNPQSAVCKTCLRGTSPTSNMIVFCDGCNTPYHRYCHHPPIDQAVVDEVDREWYCRQCEKERVMPVPDAEVADFVSVEGASAAERERYFSTLPPGVMATLLTKATTFHPDLPVFAPHFKARVAASKAMPPPPASSNTAHLQPNGHTHQPPAPATPSTVPQSTHSHPANPTTAGAPQAPYLSMADEDAEFEATYGAQHLPNYPRPGYGLMRELGPERDDEHYLVDDDDKYGVFTHLYRTDPVAAEQARG